MLPTRRSASFAGLSVANRIRHVIAHLPRISFLGIDPAERSEAKARLQRLEKRVLALLTPEQADRAQWIVQETGRRG
jgi:hypothetical protein